MKKRLTGPELLALVHHVKAGYAALPPIEVGVLSTYKARGEAAEQLLGRLAADHGARWSNRWDGHKLSIAGVSSSCTAGAAGVLLNWINAAYRKLDQGRTA
ncbi:hypothetical protein KHC23_07600 [Ancylobacter dichloromethanicus]|uniref:Uncharacterized protein n=1 Tax=Ancylobacter dichloromethanicus TaxID=518825 RepID=A0A9W6MZX2_9HYPH|nr:hypothetical protein [Ancylobacter dichloromethanicus]MBS7553510.1 hypothetical protein [Ancylobacter dichloromethanicus]GLK72568.1 hypothetical protein GCM10017643_26840 [Ancylobacter dichloromethanicus]